LLSNANLYRYVVAFGWASILDVIRSGASRVETKADGAKVGLYGCSVGIQLPRSA
jgi:hypothetical protein